MSKEIVKKISATNTDIEIVCKKKKFPFLHNYRPFRDKTTGGIHRHMFASKDGGLHLNLEGQRVFSNFLLQAVKRIR